MKKIILLALLAGALNISGTSTDLQRLRADVDALAPTAIEDMLGIGQMQDIGSMAWIGKHARPWRPTGEAVVLALTKVFRTVPFENFGTDPERTISFLIAARDVAQTGDFFTAQQLISQALWSVDDSETFTIPGRGEFTLRFLLMNAGWGIDPYTPA